VSYFKNSNSFIITYFIVTEAMSGFISNSDNENTFYKVADNYIRHAPTNQPKKND